VGGLNDPDAVRAEYASETRFLTRSSIYAAAEGIDARDVIIEQVLAADPEATLEVGCGPASSRLGCETSTASWCVRSTSRLG
jgi:hypothetical protein